MITTEVQVNRRQSQKDYLGHDGIGGETSTGVCPSQYTILIFDFIIGLAIYKGTPASGFAEVLGLNRRILLRISKCHS